MNVEFIITHTSYFPLFLHRQYVCLNFSPHEIYHFCRKMINMRYVNTLIFLIGSSRSKSCRLKDYTFFLCLHLFHELCSFQVWKGPLFRSNIKVQPSGRLEESEFGVGRLHCGGWIYLSLIQLVSNLNALHIALTKLTEHVHTAYK